MQKGDDLGKFRQLDEIMLIDEYPGYQHLSSVAEDSMQLVCEVKGHPLLIYSNSPSRNQSFTSENLLYL